MREIDILNNFRRDIEDLEIFGQFARQLCSTAPPGRSAKARRFNPFSLDEREFRYKYRFSKENMKKLIEIIRDDLDVSDMHEINNKNQVPIEFQIMAAIRYWGATEHPEITAHISGVSKQTLGRICKRVASRLAAKASRYIRMPATLSEKERVISDFQAIARMPNVFGVLDHTSIRFKRYFEDNKKKISHSTDPQNEGYFHIQIVSDASCKIRDIDCKLRPGNPESPTAIDANEIFKQTRIKDRFEQNEFRGRILLGKGGNGGLSCTNYLFTPVDEPANAEDHAFNRSHEATMALADKCLRQLKKRFNILSSEIGFNINTTRNTIISLAVLHNMSVEWNDISLDNMNFGITANNSILAGLLRGSETNTRSEFIRTNFS